MQARPSTGRRPDSLSRPAAGRLGVAVNLLGLIAALALALYLADALLAGQQALATAIAGLSFIILVLALNQRIGLWVWIVFTPFAAFFRVPMGHGLPDLGLHRVASLTLLGLLMAQAAIGRRRLARFTWVEAAAAFYIFGMALSSLNSGLGKIAAVQTVFDFFVLPLLMYVLGRNLQAGHGDDVTGLTVALAVVGIVLSLATIHEQLTGIPFLSPHPYTWWYTTSGIHKIVSVFGQPPMMTMTLALIAPALFYGVIQAKNLGTRLLWSSALAITVLGDFMVYVRGGWLATAVGLGAMLALSRRARRYVLPFLAVAALLLAVAGGQLINQRAVEERLASQKPIEYRTGALAVGWTIVKSSPLFGIGLGNFSQAAVDEGWLPRVTVGGLPEVSPHNAYLYIMLAAGLLGLAPFLAMLGLIAWRAIALWRKSERRPVYKDLLALLLGTLAAYVTILATFDGITVQFANMLMFLIAGVVFGAHEPDPTVTAA